MGELFLPAVGFGDTRGDGFGLFLVLGLLAGFWWPSSLGEDLGEGRGDVAGLGEARGEGRGDGRGEGLGEAQAADEQLVPRGSVMLFCSKWY